MSGVGPNHLVKEDSKWLDAIDQLQQRQSPININQSTVKYQDYRPFTFLGHEKLSISSGTLTAANTGTTVKLVAESGTALLEGGPLNVRYEFVEMHFHWGDVETKDKVAGSEHTFDDLAFPLELHMVHKNMHDSSVAGALTHENGLCVLGFVFTIVMDDAEIPTTGMDILTHIAEHHLKNPDDKFDQHSMNNITVGGDVNVANFIPLHVEEYFHYRGSLTTGGCEEAVNWVVFKTPLAIKEKHLRALQSIRNTGGTPIINNYRPTMPVNKRPIYYHGNDLLARNMITMGSRVGLKSKEHAAMVDQEFIKNLKI